MGEWNEAMREEGRSEEGRRGRGKRWVRQSRQAARLQPNGTAVLP